MNLYIYIFFLLHITVWDNEKSGRFSWMWHEATTYHVYQNETSYEYSLIGTISATGKGGSSQTNIKGVMHVLQSLTPNARSIFRFLLDNQLERDDGYEGSLIYVYFERENSNIYSIFFL